MSTVWIYTDTSKQVGDVDQLKVFDTAEAFDRWKDEYDPEGVAFEYPVIGDAGENDPAARSIKRPRHSRRGPLSSGGQWEATASAL